MKSRPLPAQPTILVIANGKGGVGKTTTAMALAGIFAETYKVLAVDADSQGSFSWWVKQGEHTLGFDLAQETDPDLLQNLRRIPDYELIIVDTPPALGSHALAAVVPAADYLILPTPPAPMDLTALIGTVRETVKPAGVAHRVLLTRVDTRSLAEAEDAQQTLSELGIPACQTIVRAYKAHERAALEGVPIHQWRGRNAHIAASDYRLVAQEIQQDWRKKQ